MKSKKMTKSVANKRKINVLTVIISVLTALIVAASTIIGVGFGVYGPDASTWFKPKNSNTDVDVQPAQEEVLPTPVEYGSLVSFNKDVEGLPVYINTSAETDAMLRGKAQELKDSGYQYDAFYYVLGFFCTTEIPEGADPEELELPEGTVVFGILMGIEIESGRVVIGIDGGGSETILLYSSDGKTSFDAGEGDPENAQQGFSKEYIDETGRILLPTEKMSSVAFYACDRSLMGSWFTDDADMANALLSTTPFNA